jgi:hypothetical protein
MRVHWTAGDGELEGVVHSFVMTPDGIVAIVMMEGKETGFFVSVPFHKLRIKLAPLKVKKKNG